MPHELFVLFPVKATTHHLGLAISKLLVEAQGGRLSYEVHTLPQASYTEFIINLPAAHTYHVSVEEVHTS
jgi:K+-sensing histidine kinase KdpD